MEVKDQQLHGFVEMHSENICSGIANCLTLSLYFVLFISPPSSHFEFSSTAVQRGLDISEL